MAVGGYASGIAGTREEVTAELTQIVAEVLQVRPGDLVETADLCTEFGMESLDLAEVLAAMEDRYRVKIPDSDHRDVRTLLALRQLLDRHALLDRHDGHAAGGDGR